MTAFCATRLPIRQSWTPAVADLDLVAAELKNADALTAVSDKILAIGTVKLENGKLVKDGEVTAESGPKIEEARKAYDALTEEQKKLFGKAYPEYLEALETAEKAYEQIKDTEAAKEGCRRGRGNDRRTARSRQDHPSR